MIYMKAKRWQNQKPDSKIIIYKKANTGFHKMYIEGVLKLKI